MAFTGTHDEEIRDESNDCGASAVIGIILGLLSVCGAIGFGFAAYNWADSHVTYDTNQRNYNACVAAYAADAETNSKNGHTEYYPTGSASCWNNTFGSSDR